MLELITDSAAGTEAAAKRLAPLLRPGDIIAYTGGLGAGKTTFTRGLASALGLGDQVQSPTFTLINEYRGERCRLCHLDAYRLFGEEALLETGFFDYIDSGWIAAVEWSENLSLSPDFVVAMQNLGENKRKITITGRGI